MRSLIYNRSKNICRSGWLNYTVYNLWDVTIWPGSRTVRSHNAPGVPLLSRGWVHQKLNRLKALWLLILLVCGLYSLYTIYANCRKDRFSSPNSPGSLDRPIWTVRYNRSVVASRNQKVLFSKTNDNDNRGRWLFWISMSSSLQSL